ncbi:unnamed protein product [Urochloa humidicola]
MRNTTLILCAHHHHHLLRLKNLPSDGARKVTYKQGALVCNLRISYMFLLGELLSREKGMEEAAGAEEMMSE